MVQKANERHKLIFDARASGKSLRETANLFGISRGRVQQIVNLYQQRLVHEENLRSSSDPLEKALYDGKISTRLYNNLIRSGYGESFGIDELLAKLRTNSITILDFRDVGPKSLTRLQEVFLTQDEIDALNCKD